MKNFLSDFFYFNKRERHGIYALFILIFLVAASNLFILPYIKQKPSVPYADYKFLITKYDSLDQVGTRSTDSIIQLFEFDPNNLTLEDWAKLGLKTGQAQVIINYRNKGGVFKNKEDLKKIYSIDDELYNKLEPFIKIETQTFTTKITKTNSPASNNEPIELNSADSTLLTQIRGIGPVLSTRIIKYRNLLGGYHKVEQLKEVYGIDPDKFESIKDRFCQCDLSKIRQLNINTCEFNQLLKHPYISYDFTKHIVNRRIKEVFENPEEAFNIEFISDSAFQKLLPYLSTNHK